MEIEITKNEKDCLEFKLIGEKHTYPAMLKQALLEDSSVTMASYLVSHPLANQSKFVLKTKGKTAIKALEEASKKIDTQLSDFEKAVKKAVK